MGPTEKERLHTKMTRLRAQNSQQFVQCLYSLSTGPLCERAFGRKFEYEKTLHEQWQLSDLKNISLIFSSIFWSGILSLQGQEENC